MKRILTAAVLIPFIAWTVLWSPPWAFLAVLALVGGCAFYEFDNIAGAHGLTRSGWCGLIAGVIFLLLPYPPITVLPVVVMVLMAVQLRNADYSKALPSVSATLLGIVYIFGAWHCAILLREYDRLLLMVPLLVSWSGDIAALYAGRTWGKHKLAPSISPGKTKEGAAASVIAGAIVAALYVHFTDASMRWPQALVLGAITNVAGQWGDLCESAFKRGAGMKDSGTMLPGHGGWLDRIDSTLFCIPVFYAALRLWP